MGECLIIRRGGEPYKLPALNENYPMDLTVVNGMEATFYVMFDEHGRPADYVYNWYVDDILVDGVNDSTYVRDTTLDKGSYTIYCEVMNKAGIVTSRVATCNVMHPPVLDDAYPKDITVDAAETSVTLEVVVTENVSDGECTYQWYYDGNAIDGATDRIYIRPAVFGTHNVYCIVTNQAGSTFSRTAAVTANGVYLYRLGDTCDAITGGWGGGLENGYISFGGEDNNGPQAYTKNKISFEGYTKLVFEYEFTSGHGSGLGNIQLAVSDRAEIAYRTDYAIAGIQTNTLEIGKTYTVELDISYVTQDAHVRCGGWYGSGKLYNVWLEGW